jgi:hypothetical protein
MNNPAHLSRLFPLLVLAVALAAPVAFGGVNRWTSGGSLGSRIESMAVDPTNPQTVYAVTSRAVFKSRDGGVSWTISLGAGDFWRLQSTAFFFPPGALGGDGLIGGLAIDSLSPSSVYAATNAGVFKSTDAGGSWKGVGPSNSAVHSLAIDPSDPSIILAGTEKGLFKSADGGVSWSGSLLAASIYSLLFSAQRPATIYAFDYDNAPYYPEPSTAYRSTDGGANWTQSKFLTDVPPGALAIDPKDPSTLYSGGILRHSYDFEQGLFKSVDSGLTWTQQNNQAVTAVVVDHRDPSKVYGAVDRGGFIQSVDGGMSWRDFNTGWTFPPASVTSLAIDQTGTRLHAGTENGEVFSYQISSGAVEISSAAVDLSAGEDGRTSVLFAGDNRAASRDFDMLGKSMADGPYGPYEGWSARAVANGNDGLTRVLWNHRDGSVALWFLGPPGQGTSRQFGPTAGWTAVDVSVGSDGTTHLLWANADGRTELASVAVTGELVGDATYGPFRGWIAVSISDGADGLTRLLWSNTDGRVGLTLIDAGRIVATYRFAPGAGWTARDIAVSADNQARILFADAVGRMALWSVDNSGAVTNSATVYEPPRSGEAAVRVSTGADGLTRVLWTGPDGGGHVLLMGLDNVLRSSFGFCGDFGQDSGCGEWDY